MEKNSEKLQVKKELLKKPSPHAYFRSRKLEIFHEKSLKDIKENESPKTPTYFSVQKVTEKKSKYQIFNFSTRNSISGRINAKTQIDSPEIDKEMSSLEDFNNSLSNNYSEKSSFESINNPNSSRKKGLSYSKKERNIDVLTRSCSHSSKEEKVSFLPKINMKISPQKSIGLKTRSSLCVTTTVDESHILPKIQKMSKFKSDKR